MAVSETEKQVILIVDDQTGNIALLSDILSDLGDIYFVTDSTQAYEKALQLQPDVILLDIEMPQLNGFEVCQQLKNSPLTCDISIIFISALTEAEFEAHTGALFLSLCY